MSTGATPPETPPSYAAAAAELADILAELEGGRLDVDVLVERVERARVLIKFCQGRLVGARAQIKDVLEDLSG